MYRRSALSVLILSGSLLSAVSAAYAADKQIYTGRFNSQALSGYDPVAYFTEHKPVQGDSRFSTQYAGAEWRFASAENRDKFLADPQHYAPQYGGYCAWAVSEGSTASGDPQRWKIVDDKLYLNYNADIQKKWELDIAGNIRKADKNWPTVLGK